MAGMSKGASLTIAGASLTAFFSQSFRTFVARWAAVNAPGGYWRILAILLVIANLKNMPFVWHFRVFRGLLYQIYLQPTPIPPHALFHPVITSTRTSLLETDYNLHKSNSTYFSDLDVSRSHLFTAIIRNGIKKHSRMHGKNAARAVLGATEGTHGKHIVALGGISCLFKKEILPYQKFEMWTRILCWDRKWFYLITHMVKPGVAKPRGFSLQPWRRVEAGDVDREKLKGAIFASSLAKYVVKEGRITISPEKVLRDADMVPAKPEGWVYKGAMNGHVANGSAMNGPAVDGSADVDTVLPQEAGDEWNWDVIETERLRGLEIAEHFAGLDGMHDMFDGGEKGALGEYADFLF